jgi:hypothetical protein
MRIRWRAMAVVLVAAVVAGGITSGVTLASVPESTGVVHGCDGSGNGNVRVTDSSEGQTCRPDVLSLDWNRTGPPGTSATDAADSVDFTVTPESPTSASLPIGLSPAVPITPWNLSVQLLHPVSTGSGVALTITGESSIGEPSSTAFSLDCTVPLGETTCTATGPGATIPANTPYGYTLTGIGGATWGGVVLIGYQLTNGRR